ncbi:MAG: head GIN domain-containing protein, partial [Nannocystaceae bacterium]
MSRKSIFLGAAASLLLTASPLGCAAFGMANNGAMQTESRQVTGFDKLACEGSMDTFVTIGPETKVVVEAEEGILPKVTTEVVDGTLRVGSKGSYMTSKGVTIRVTTPAVTGLSVKGSGDVELTGVSGPKLTASVAGSGDATITGTVDAFEASVAGSGEIRGFGLTTVDTSASVSGSGDIEVQVAKTLNATVSGSGDVTYRGDPA